MTKFFASTALVALLAVPAFAQTAAETTPAATTEMAAPAATDAMASTGISYMSVAGDLSADTFIGKRLYVSEADVDMTAEMNEVDADWDDIGEISDLVLTKDGQVEAVLVDIGGFLGMGEKTVAVSMDQLKIVRDGDSENEYFTVLKADKAALENAPEFKWAEM